MDRSWSWRVALIVAVTLFSVWQLVPTWHYFKLPPEERNGEAYEKSVPTWAPDARKHLTLGLDLQGGIHLAMGVDVDKAVKAKVARRADEIASWLNEKKVAFDGRARTLEDLLTGPHNPAKVAGSELSADEVRDLAAYLKSL